MSVEARNSPQDICRIIAMAMLADNDIDERETALLAELKVTERMGVSPEDFRLAIDRLCNEILVADDGRTTISITELGVITDILPLLDRRSPRDMDALSRLVQLVAHADPALLPAAVLDLESLNETLDRIDDPRLQVWTSSLLVRLVNADGAVHGNERFLVSHVINRWGISPQALAEIA